MIIVSTYIAEISLCVLAQSGFVSDFARSMLMISAIALIALMALTLNIIDRFIK